MFDLTPEGILFWFICFAIFFAPLFLVGYGAWRARSWAGEPPLPAAQGGEGAGFLRGRNPRPLRVARWLGFLAASMPLVQVLLFCVPGNQMDGVLMLAVRGLPGLTLAAALLASVLFVLHGRGDERATGPVGSLFAASVVSLLWVVASHVAP